MRLLRDGFAWISRRDQLTRALAYVPSIPNSAIGGLVAADDEVEEEEVVLA